LDGKTSFFTPLASFAQAIVVLTASATSLSVAVPAGQTSNTIAMSLPICRCASTTLSGVRRISWVTLETHSILVNFDKLCQGKHLKSAAVSQYRMRPVHKFVQSSQSFQKFRPWSQKQVIGVSQQNLDSYCLQLLRQTAFDRSLRTNRHKYGRLHLAMGQNHFASPGLGFIVGFGKLKAHQKIYSSLNLKHQSRGINKYENH
jgi:hypothetical protein